MKHSSITKLDCKPTNNTHITAIHLNWCFLEHNTTYFKVIMKIRQRLSRLGVDLFWSSKTMLALCKLRLSNSLHSIAKQPLWHMKSPIKKSLFWNPCLHIYHCHDIIGAKQVIANEIGMLNLNAARDIAEMLWLESMYLNTIVCVF